MRRWKPHHTILAAASPEAAAFFRVWLVCFEQPYLIFCEPALSGAFVLGRVRFFAFAEGGHG